MERKIIAYKNYFIIFYKEQDEKVQEKIEYVLDLVNLKKEFQLSFSNIWKVLMEFMKLELQLHLRT